MLNYVQACMGSHDLAWIATADTGSGRLHAQLSFALLLQLMSITVCLAENFETA